MKKRVVLPVAFIVTAGATIGLLLAYWPKIQTNSQTSSVIQPTVQVPVEPVFDTSAHSTSDPASLWVVVNKAHALSPASFAPTDLIQGRQGYVYSGRIETDLSALLDTATAAGLTLNISSAYRSYDNQVTLYASYVQQYGQAGADSISARPGHSEHQTGLAIDIGGISNPACNFNVCFGDTAEGAWLAAHAGDYGFIVRYTATNGNISGYSPEPWHIRYIGHELANEMKTKNISTLEEFFGISGGTTYVD